MDAIPYYFDVLPLHPQPEPLESLTSYLTRLAEINEMHSVKALATLCFPDQTLNVVRGLRDYPLSSFDTLQKRTVCSEASLLKTTFYHLGEKFGRTSHLHQLPAFLSDSVAGYLRYCPACLADQPYYSLTWRFPILQGCYKHVCHLLNECKHCNRPIPIFASSLKIGICPSCKKDIRTCPPEPLTEDELLTVHTYFQDLVFLLTS